MTTVVDGTCQFKDGLGCTRPHDETYTLPGACRTCGTEVEVKINKGHHPRTPPLLYKCPYCGNYDVDTVKRRVPAGWASVKDKP